MDKNAEEAARREARERTNTEIDDALESQREIYNAAAAWFALVDFVMTSDYPVTLEIVEKPDDVNEPIRRRIAAEFPDAIGEEDVLNQFANLADDVLAANRLREIENEQQHTKRLERDRPPERRTSSSGSSKDPE